MYVIEKALILKVHNIWIESDLDMTRVFNSNFVVHLSLCNWWNKRKTFDKVYTYISWEKFGYWCDSKKWWSALPLNGGIILVISCLLYFIEIRELFLFCIVSNVTCKQVQALSCLLIIFFCFDNKKNLNLL